MTEGSSDVDSRRDWIEFIDLLINLRQDSTNRYRNLYWLVLPLLVTVGWATLQFMYSVKVNLEIFAVSLLFLSLISLATMAAASLIPPPSEESDSPRTVDDERNLRVMRFSLTVILVPPSVSILAIVLLWRDFNNIAGHILLGFLVLQALLTLGLLCWRRASDLVAAESLKIMSRRLSRVLTVFAVRILPFLAITALAWHELWRGVWFLPFELAILEGGIVLGVLSLWFFSFARENERERLDNLISLRYEITRRGLDAKAIAEAFEVGLEALSRLSQDTETTAGGGNEEPSERG